MEGMGVDHRTPQTGEAGVRPGEEAPYEDIVRYEPYVIKHKQSDKQVSLGWWRHLYMNSV